MNTLRVKDNSSISKENFESITHLTKRIADKTLAQLEKEGIFVFPELVKDSEDTDEKQMILQSVNDHFETSNLMGFLGEGDERLFIESRFESKHQDYFLQYMLEKVVDFPNLLELEIDANQENRIFNLLLFLFPYYLKAAMRKGNFKTYIRNEYNDTHIKGTIDIARHIKINTPFLGKVAYNQREFSYDNYLMELIRHTIEFIKHKSYGGKVLYKVRDEVNAVVTITNKFASQDKQKIIQINKNRPITHAYYHEYQALQRLCILILQHEKHQIGSGIRQVHGILFDGAWLWEEYINTVIQNRFYHPMNKSHKGAQELFSTSRGKVGLIYPDFISKNSSNRMIADTKYKPIGNINRKDYLQVLAYMFRFDACCGFYLYPKAIEEADLCLEMNQGVTYENNVGPRGDVSIIKCGLTIPNEVKNYHDFVTQIHRNEQKLVF